MMGRQRQPKPSTVRVATQVNKPFLFVASAIGGAISGKLALPQRPLELVLPAGAAFGVLSALTVVLHRRWRGSLGRNTVWAALACVWGGVFAVVGLFAGGCSTMACRVESSASLAGAGALLLVTLGIIAGSWGIMRAFGRLGRRLLGRKKRAEVLPPVHNGRTTTPTKAANKTRKRPGRR